MGDYQGVWLLFPPFKGDSRGLDNNIDTLLYRVRACKAWYNIAISFYQGGNPERVYILWKVNYEEWKVFLGIITEHLTNYRNRVRRR